MNFRDKIERLKQQAALEELAILVWGSGAGDRRNYEKRVKIKDNLNSLFPNADVHFSEDDEIKELSGGDELTAPERELWQLGACDVCVVLDTSIGPQSEIAHFCNSKFAYKLLILTHERHKGTDSFASQLRENLNQIYYTDEEFDSCNLVQRVIIRVQQVALDKLSHS